MPCPYRAKGEGIGEVILRPYWKGTTHSWRGFRIVFWGIWCRVVITRPGVRVKVLPGNALPFVAASTPVVSLSIAIEVQ